jgi:hypothetical protein
VLRDWFGKVLWQINVLYVVHKILYVIATAIAKNINIILMDAEHVKSQSLLLDQRWEKVRPIPNTLKIHYVKPLSLYNVE